MKFPRIPSHTFFFLLASGFLLFPGGPTLGQDPSPESKSPATAIPEERTSASVAYLSESRSRRADRDPSGSTSVTIRFEAPSEEMELLRVELTKASDSLGNDLINPEKITADTVGRMQVTEEDRTEARVSLEAAAREATSITEISGTVVFHDPSEAKKPVVISDFREYAGEFVPNEALKEAGVSVAFLNAETFDEKGFKLVSKLVLGETASENAEIASATVAPMKMMVSMPTTLAFIIDDPNKQIVKVEGLGEEGDEVAGTGIESVKGLWILAVLDQEVTISRLRLHLKSAGAEVARGFTIKDISLP